MISEINEIRQHVEADIQIMETAVANKTAPVDVTDFTTTQQLSESFGSLYYEIAAFAEVHKFSTLTINQSTLEQSQNSSTMAAFQMPNGNS
jgi:hypothetical protein